MKKKNNLPSPRINVARKGVYFLPNALTTAALFCGFFSIIQSMNGRYDVAAIAIFVALIFDGMDGRVARMTNSQSEFGAQYDSLSDMVAFGVSPAILAYMWGLVTLDKWGWLSVFIYCAGAALRLARFNSNAQQSDKRHFQGLPSPAAAALVAATIILIEDRNLPGSAWIIPVFILTLLAGCAMVSNLPYRSFKDMKGHRSVPFVWIFMIVIFLAVFAYDPAMVLFVVFFAFALSGLMATLLNTAKRLIHRNQGGSSESE